MTKYTPLWHLTGATHIEGLDHSTEAIGCHGDNILHISIHLSFHYNLRVQQGRQLWHRGGVVSLPLFEKQGGYLTTRGGGGGGGRVFLGSLHLSGDEHQPLVEGMPQQLQRLQRCTVCKRRAGQQKTQGTFVRGNEGL